MTRPPPFTKGGRDFDAVSSLLQKSLRRGDIVMASRAVNELLPRYANYCWNRLMVVSAEDCADMVTAEIVALYDAWRKVMQDTNPKSRPGQRGRPVFFAKAIVLLAKAKHSRDADELTLLVSDRLPDNEFDAALAECEVETDSASTSDWDIPDYVYDVHTKLGRKRGKTRREFLRDEHDALSDATTVFSNADEMIDSDGYVQPELEWP
jgi:hypothetical protein